MLRIVFIICHQGTNGSHQQRQANYCTLCRRQFTRSHAHHFVFVQLGGVDEGKVSQKHIVEVDQEKLQLLIRRDRRRHDAADWILGERFIDQ